LAAAQELRDRNVPNDFQLAAVDVFVEKAQKQLSDRAASYRVWGCVTALASLALIVFGIIVLRDNRTVTTMLSELEVADRNNPWIMTLVLLRASSMAGLMAGAIIYLIFISRALLHEMVVLYQRRHALRFGRLFIYLHPEKISVEEMLAAFNWNAEYRSAFRDIRADKIMQGIPGKVLDTSVELAHSSVEALKQARNKS
jgi:hypothetical protein